MLTREHRGLIFMANSPWPPRHLCGHVLCRPLSQPLVCCDAGYVAISQLEALRVPPAETWLTVYRRRQWCEALSRIFPNRAPLRGFEAPPTSWSSGKCHFFEMVKKIIQNRMKVEILILICQVMMNSVQFPAKMNIEMTQKKLFEIWR